MKEVVTRLCFDVVKVVCSAGAGAAFHAEPDQVVLQTDNCGAGGIVAPFAAVVVVYPLCRDRTITANEDY